MNHQGFKALLMQHGAFSGQIEGVLGLGLENMGFSWIFHFSGPKKSDV